MIIIDKKELDSKKSYFVIKRVVDIFVSINFLIFFMPLLLCIGLAIYIDDPKGSPIFKQKRVGKGKTTFTCYKFRTMCIDAEKKLDGLLNKNEMDGPVFKIKNDPRITKIGHFLRQTCLDELPQFANVLSGSMSIVGPRPPLPREVEQYTDYQRQRLLIKPGLTCYWQIQPKRNTVTFDEWMDLDMQYIHDCSLREDLKIVLKTVKAVINREGE